MSEEVQHIVLTADYGPDHSYIKTVCGATLPRESLAKSAKWPKCKTCQHQWRAQ